MHGCQQRVACRGHEQRGCLQLAADQQRPGDPAGPPAAAGPIAGRCARRQRMSACPPFPNASSLQQPFPSSPRWKSCPSSNACSSPPLADPQPCQAHSLAVMTPARFDSTASGESAGRRLAWRYSHCVPHHILRCSKRRSRLGNDRAQHLNACPQVEADAHPRCLLKQAAAKGWAHAAGRAGHHRGPAAGHDSGLSSHRVDARQPRQYRLLHADMAGSRRSHEAGHNVTAAAQVKRDVGVGKVFRPAGVSSGPQQAPCGVSLEGAVRTGAQPGKGTREQASMPQLRRAALQPTDDMGQRANTCRRNLIAGVRQAGQLVPASRRAPPWRSPFAPNRSFADALSSPNIEENEEGDRLRQADGHERMEGAQQPAGASGAKAEGEWAARWSTMRARDGDRRRAAAFSTC